MRLTATGPSMALFKSDGIIAADHATLYHSSIDTHVDLVVVGGCT